MTLLRRSRSAAYRYARAAGDVGAVGSPSKMVRRYTRKYATRKTMGLISRLFR